MRPTPLFRRLTILKDVAGSFQETQTTKEQKQHILLNKSITFIASVANFKLDENEKLCKGKNRLDFAIFYFNSIVQQLRGKLSAFTLVLLVLLCRCVHTYTLTNIEIVTNDLARNSIFVTPIFYFKH